MKSATNHMVFITGKPRTGKSGYLIGQLEDAVEKPSTQAAFLFVDKVDIQHLPNRCLLVQRKAEQCAIQTFLDAAGDDVKKFTHLFIDDVSVGTMPGLLRFAQSFPDVTIVAVVN